jgi:Holliday junction resolvasome RuvABC endonuclease subunit
VTDVLAIDPGVNLGWAIFTAAGEFSCGTLYLGEKRGSTNGIRFLAFRTWLESVHDKEHLERIAYEQTLTRHRSGAQAALANGLVAIMEAFASQRGVELVTINNATLKKWATGSGRAEKADMLLAAQRRWGKRCLPKDQHDTVDAVWILNWTLHSHGAPGGTHERLMAFDGAPVPCAVCGEEIARDLYFAVENHRTGHTRFKHPSCLHPGDGKKRAKLAAEKLSRAAEDEQAGSPPGQRDLFGQRGLFDRTG